MKRRRLELPRHNCHYPLKVARLPIPPSLQKSMLSHFSVPRTGLEPARLSTLAPETSASTIPPPGHPFRISPNHLSGKRDSNSRPRPWQGRALPTELFPHKMLVTINQSSVCHSPECGCKGTIIFLICKHLPQKKRDFFIFTLLNTSGSCSRRNQNDDNIPTSRRYAAWQWTDGESR